MSNDTVINNPSGKTKATKIAMTIAFSLAVMKALVGFFTGSLAVLASAVDSILDILSSFFNYVAIKKAEEPADNEHEFGHGKYEALATFIQSIIIFISGLFILISAWNKFKEKQYEDVSNVSIWVMVISIIATIFLTIYLRYMAKKEKSSLLEADSMHYAIDLYTNIGILFALVIIKFTSWNVIDPIIAAIVAIYIIFSAIKLSLKVSNELLDGRVEEETYNKLVNVLKSFEGYHKDFHRLRTRSAGNEKFIDMHMTLCSKLTLAEVHYIIDKIEDAIRKEIPDADITIHPEPCNHHNEDYNFNNCNSDRIKAGLEMICKDSDCQNHKK